MRNISAPSLTKLTTNLGTEPIFIIEIQWVDNGPRVSYADRDVAVGIHGKIIEVSGLDAVVQVSGGSSSEQISLTLDDTDNSIKAIMDSTDIHKRPCWVYQWFDGIDVAEKFLIFKGVLNSPITWDEGARTISFDVISKIEDVEVGFSIEEGDFIDPPEELIGRPWPLCFGTVINVPALKASSVHRGTLATGTGIRDFTLARRLRLAQDIICPQNFAGFRARSSGNTYGSIIIEPVYLIDQNCVKSKCEAVELIKLQQTEQAAYEYSPVRIYGGEKFPQNVTITLNIGGGKFTGTFSGDIFTISSRFHPDNDGAGNVIKSETQTTIESQCGTNLPPAGSPEDLLTNGDPGVSPTLNAKASKESWDRYNAVTPANFFWATAGSEVTIDNDDEILYIANLLPSTILRVAAWRELNGGRKLLTVPEEYYEIRQTDYTGYTGVMEIVFSKPLTRRDLEAGGGWSDEIYITMTSSVGPNTVDIIEWFIDTYTDYAVDTASFDAVRDLIDNYPMHFPLLVRKNIITVLEEIAYQARCALWMKDDVFYIKYLALEPDVDETITEDDVLPNTLQIQHTPTEDLVTKYVANWRKDYAIDDPNVAIYRHNVKKYGTHTEEYEFYCFNILELVRKAATYWLIRKSNTWRKAVFKTPMHKLLLESFDTVGLTLPDMGPGEIKGMVEKANFNSDDRTIDFEVWTPCKSGTNTTYNLAWPADIDEQTIFPTLEERDLGLAGSGNLPNFSVIAPNQHPLSNDTTGLWGGFQEPGNGCNQGEARVNGACRPDHGDKNPSDVGDTKPTPNASADQTGQVSTGTSPVTNSGGGGSDCCAAAKKVADQALKEAQEARTQAQEAAKKAGQEESEEQSQEDGKKKLPPVCGGECTATVQVTYITPTTVALPPGSESFNSSEPGVMGNLAIGDPGNTECYTFNTSAAAIQFAEETQAEIAGRDNYGWEVGKKDKWLVSLSAELGVDGEGAPCAQPGAEDAAMTGYTPGE